MEPMAAYIRQHPNITGFSINSRMHIISLFADDIILMLTNVTSSLGSVHQALQMFNTLSYYKGNETKSYMLGLGLSSEVRNSINNEFPYAWKEKGITYLGITLTPRVTDLVKENYIHFLHSFRSKLDKLGKRKLSRSGRLAAFKMQVLPQLLYLYRTLPIPVPNSFFFHRHNQNYIDTYGWGKKACCIFCRLIKHKKVGGMGQTNIKEYSAATILAQLRGWFTTHHTTLWAELEQHQVMGGNLYNYLITSTFRSTTPATVAPTVQASTEAWRYLKKSILPTGTLIPLKFPITAISLLIPNISLTNWCTSRMLLLEDLFVGPTPKTCISQQLEYFIPHSEFYRCIQISHLLKQDIKLITYLPWQVALYYTSTTTKTKGTSLIYNHLQSKQVFSKTPNIQAWERDLGKEYNMDQWGKALSITYASLRSANMWELYQKIMLQWYLTPYRLSKFAPRLSSRC